jgi:transcriptional regulator NrdR family protein
MVCLYCSEKLRVSNSRTQKSTNSIWRRRSCPACRAVFTSIEAISLENSIRVSDSKALEPFMKEKLFMSVYESLKHKQKPLQDARDVTETICSKLMRQHIQAATLDRQVIISVATEILRRYDSLAGMHYQARFRH